MFTHNIQLAGYPFDKFDEKGITHLKKFITTFDSFPWPDQLAYYNKIKAGCSATISVKDVENNHDFWVSIAGDPQKHIFLVGLVYIKTKKSFLGLGKKNL